MSKRFVRQSSNLSRRPGVNLSSISEDEPFDSHFAASKMYEQHNGGFEVVSRSYVPAAFAHSKTAYETPDILRLPSHGFQQPITKRKRDEISLVSTQRQLPLSNHSGGQADSQIVPSQGSSTRQHNNNVGMLAQAIPYWRMGMQHAAVTSETENNDDFGDDDQIVPYEEAVGQFAVPLVLGYHNKETIDRQPFHMVPEVRVPFYDSRSIKPQLMEEDDDDDTVNVETTGQNNMQTESSSTPSVTYGNQVTFEDGPQVGKTPGVAVTRPTLQPVGNPTYDYGEAMSVDGDTIPGMGDAAAAPVFTGQRRAPTQLSPINGKAINPTQGSVPFTKDVMPPVYRPDSTSRPQQSSIKGDPTSIFAPPSELDPFDPRKLNTSTSHTNTAIPTMPNSGDANAQRIRDAENEAAQKKIREMKTAADVSAFEKSQHVQTIESLRKQLFQAQEALRETLESGSTQDDTRPLRQRIVNLEQRISELEDSVIQTTSEASFHARNSRQLSQELQQAKEELDQLRFSTASDARRREQDTRQKISDLQDELASRQTSEQQLRLKLKQVEEELADVRTSTSLDSDRMKKRIDVLEKEKIIIMDQMSYDNDGEANTTLRRKVVTLTTQAAEAAHAQTDAQQQIMHLNQKILTLEQTLRENSDLSETERQKFIRDIHSLTLEKTSKELELQSLLNDNKAMQQSLNRVKDELVQEREKGSRSADEFASNLAAMQSERMKLLMRLTELEEVKDMSTAQAEEIRELRRKGSDLEQKIREMTDSIERMTTDRQREVREASEALRREQEAHAAVLQEHVTANTVLSKKLETESKIKDELTSDVARKSSHIEQLARGHQTTLQNLREQHEQEVAQLKKLIETNKTKKKSVTKTRTVEAVPFPQEYLMEEKMRKLGDAHREMRNAEGEEKEYATHRYNILREEFDKLDDERESWKFHHQPRFETYTEEIDDADAAEEMSREIASQKSRVKGLEHQMKTLSETHTAELNELKSQLEKAKKGSAAAVELQAKITTLEDTIRDDARFQGNTAISLKLSRDAPRSDIAKAIDLLKDNNDKLNDTNRTLDKTKSDLAENKKALDALQKAYADQTTKAKSDASSSKKALTESEEKYNTVTITLRSAESKIKKKETEALEMQRKQTELEGKIADLESRLKSEKSTRTSQGDQAVRETTALIEKHKKALEAVNKKLVEANETIATMKQEHEANIRKLKNEHQIAVDELNTKNEQMRIAHESKFKILESQSKQTASDLKSLEEKHVLLQSREQALKDEKSRLEQTVSDEQDNVRTLQSDLRSAKEVNTTQAKSNEEALERMQSAHALEIKSLMGHHTEALANAIRAEQIAAAIIATKLTAAETQLAHSESAHAQDREKLATAESRKLAAEGELISTQSSIRLLQGDLIGLEGNAQQLAETTTDLLNAQQKLDKEREKVEQLTRDMLSLQQAFTTISELAEKNEYDELKEVAKANEIAGRRMIVTGSRKAFSQLVKMTKQGTAVNRGEIGPMSTQATGMPPPASTRIQSTVTPQQSGIIKANSLGEKVAQLRNEEEMYIGDDDETVLLDDTASAVGSTRSGYPLSAVTVPLDDTASAVGSARSARSARSLGASTVLLDDTASAVGSARSARSARSLGASTVLLDDTASAVGSARSLGASTVLLDDTASAVGSARSARSLGATTVLLPGETTEETPQTDEADTTDETLIRHLPAKAYFNANLAALVIDDGRQQFIPVYNAAQEIIGYHLVTKGDDTNNFADGPWSDPRDVMRLADNNPDLEFTINDRVIREYNIPEQDLIYVGGQRRITGTTFKQYITPALKALEADSRRGYEANKDASERVVDSNKEAAIRAFGANKEAASANRAALRANKEAIDRVPKESNESNSRKRKFKEKPVKVTNEDVLKKTGTPVLAEKSKLFSRKAIDLLREDLREKAAQAVGAEPVKRKKKRIQPERKEKDEEELASAAPDIVPHRSALTAPRSILTTETDFDTERHIVHPRSSRAISKTGRGLAIKENMKRASVLRSPDFISQITSASRGPYDFDNHLLKNLSAGSLVDSIIPSLAEHTKNVISSLSEKNPSVRSIQTAFQKIHKNPFSLEAVPIYANTALDIHKALTGGSLSQYQVPTSVSDIRNNTNNNGDLNVFDTSSSGFAYDFSAALDNLHQFNLDSESSFKPLIVTPDMILNEQELNSLETVDSSTDVMGVVVQKATSLANVVAKSTGGDFDNSVDGLADRFKSIQDDAIRQTYECAFGASTENALSISDHDERREMGRSHYQELHDKVSAANYNGSSYAQLRTGIVAQSYLFNGKQSQPYSVDVTEDDVIRSINEELAKSHFGNNSIVAPLAPIFNKFARDGMLLDEQMVDDNLDKALTEYQEAQEVRLATALTAFVEGFKQGSSLFNLALSNTSFFIDTTQLVPQPKLNDLVQPLQVLIAQLIETPDILNKILAFGSEEPEFAVDTFRNVMNSTLFWQRHLLPLFLTQNSFQGRMINYLTESIAYAFFQCMKDLLMKQKLNPSDYERIGLSLPNTANLRDLFDKATNTLSILNEVTVVDKSKYKPLPSIGNDNAQDGQEDTILQRAILRSEINQNIQNVSGLRPYGNRLDPSDSRGIQEYLAMCQLYSSGMYPHRSQQRPLGIVANPMGAGFSKIMPSKSSIRVPPIPLRMETGRFEHPMVKYPKSKTISSSDMSGAFSIGPAPRPLATMKMALTNPGSRGVSFSAAKTDLENDNPLRRKVHFTGHGRSGSRYDVDDDDDDDDDNDDEEGVAGYEYDDDYMKTGGGLFDAVGGLAGEAFGGPMGGLVGSLTGNLVGSAVDGFTSLFEKKRPMISPQQFASNADNSMVRIANAVHAPQGVIDRFQGHNQQYGIPSQYQQQQQQQYAPPVQQYPVPQAQLAQNQYYSSPPYYPGPPVTTQTGGSLSDFRSFFSHERKGHVRNPKLTAAGISDATADKWLQNPKIVSSSLRKKGYSLVFKKVSKSQTGYPDGSPRLTVELRPLRKDLPAITGAGRVLEMLK